MSISFSGLASGLDTSSWVTSLTQLRQAKVTKLEEQKQTVAVAQSTLQGIRSFFASFRSSLEKITDSKFKVSSMDIFSKKIAEVSNAAVLSATAKSNAAEGSYEVKVNNTATQTQVKSGYRYKTTLISTTQATTSSYFRNIGIGYGTDPETGIKAGNIEITNNGVTSTISISANETMNSFLDKLHAVGIEAEFDNDTGIFSIGVNASDINDIGNTNILSKLKITDINYGYTCNQLKKEESHEEYTQATTDTLLSDLGVSTGTINIHTANGDYELTLEQNDTIGSLVNALRSQGIEATFNDGVFSINNALITSDGTTGLIEHFGLQTPSIASQTQESGGLTYQTVYTSTTTADIDTYLKDIEGVTLTSDQTIKVQDAEGNISTITVGTTSTIGSMIDDMNAAGLNASLSPSGILKIEDGWIIDGGTFDVESAFGLQYTGVARTVTGSQLTVTTTTISGATSDTKLKDLTTAVTSGTIKITDTTDNVHNLVINENDTIGDVVQRIRDLGLGASFDDTTGVLTLTGGSYTTNGLAEADKSNFLQVFFGQDTLTPNTIDSATSTSQALRESIETTHLATGTTSLGELGMANGTYTATFKKGATEVAVEINQNTTLNDIVSSLRAGSIDAVFSNDIHGIVINEGEFVGVTGGNFDTIMNFNESIVGKLATSDVIKAQTVTSGVEQSSSSAVNHNVYTTTTIEQSVTTTTATVSTSGTITYNSIENTDGTTTTVGQTATSTTVFEVTTTATTQTGATLEYDVITPGGSSTQTTGQAVTSGSIMTGETTPAAQSSGTLTYTQTSVTNGYTETTPTGVTQTSTITYTSTELDPGQTTTVMASESSQTSTLNVVETITTPGTLVTTAVNGSQQTDPLTWVTTEIAGGTTIMSVPTQTTTISQVVTTELTGGTTAGVTTTMVSNTLYYNSVTPESTTAVYALSVQGEQVTYQTSGTVGRTQTSNILGTEVTIGTGYTKRLYSGGMSHTPGNNVTLNTYLCDLYNCGNGTITVTYSNGQTEAFDTTTTTLGSFITTINQTTGATNMRLDTDSGNKLLRINLTNWSGTYTTDPPTIIGIKVNRTDNTSYNYVLGTIPTSVTTVEADGTMTLGDAGFSGSRSDDIVLSDGTHLFGGYPNYQNITFNQLVDELNSHGVTASFSNGQLTVGSSNDTVYISSIGGVLGSFLGISTGNGVSYNSNGTIYQAMTTSTKLQDLGITSNQYVTLRDGTTITINKTLSISSTLWSIQSATSTGYISWIENGVVNLDARNNLNPDKIISGMSTQLKAALGLTGKIGNNQTYVTGNADSTCSAIGLSFTITPDNTFDVNTTLSDLGYSGTYMDIYDNNNNYIIIRETDTLESMYTKLQAFTDGGVIMQGDGVDLLSLTGTASTLTISFTAGHTTAITNIDKMGTLNNPTILDPAAFGYGRSFTYSEESGTTILTTATGTTTLGDLGFRNGTGYIVISNRNNETATMIVDRTTDLGYIMQNINACGNLSASLSNGQITISQTGNGEKFITEISDNLKGILGGTIDAGEGITYNVSNGTYQTVTSLATGTTKLGELGLTHDAVVELYHYNTATSTTTYYTVTFGTDTTLYEMQRNEFFGKFASAAKFRYDNEKNINEEGTIPAGATELNFTLDYDPDKHITYIDEDLADILHLDYTTTVSGQSSQNVTHTATGTTTFGTLGLTAQATITTDTGIVTVNTDTTIDDLADDLYNNHDIWAIFSEYNGRLTIGSYSNDHYIVSMEGGDYGGGKSLKEILSGFQAGEGHTYNTSGSPGSTTTTTTQATGTTTMAELGMEGLTGTIVTNNTTITVSATDTLNDVMDMLDGNIVSLPDWATTVMANAGTIGGVSLEDLAAANNGFIAEVVTVAPQVTVTNVSQLASAISSYNTIGIANADVLMELSKSVEDGTDCTGKTFVLTSDIDLSEICAGRTNNEGIGGWKEIGTIEHAFTGNFDGNGHTISGLYINQPEYNNATGLFGNISGATISNVYVEGDVTGNSYVGILVGHASQSTITNCHTSGTVTGDEQVGGLVGYISGESDHNAAISNCYSTADVNSNSGAGGLIGESYYIDIENCYATGNVTGNSAGGLASVVGRDSRIENCYATGNVVAEEEEGGAGGLVASVSGDIINSYASGDVTGGYIAGGLAGLSGANISSCYSTGNVSGNDMAAGGFIGLSFTNQNHTIDQCFTTGLVSGNSMATGEFIGGVQVDTDSTLNITNTAALSNDEINMIGTSQVLGQANGLGNITGIETDGLSVSLINGVLTVEPGDDDYLVSVSPNLAAALGINAGAGITYNLDITQPSLFTSVHTATTETTLGELGMSGSGGAFTLNNGTVINVTSDTSLGSIASSLVASGVESASFQNGVLTLGNGEDTNFVTSISPNVAAVLGINAGEGVTYNVNTQNASIETTTTTIDANTTMSQLGMNSSGTITLSNGNVITVQSGDTIGSIFGALDNTSSNSITCSLTNGVITLGNAGDTNYITSMSSNIAAALGIEAGEGHSYNVNGVTASMNSTLAEIGMSGATARIITDYSTVDLTSTSTIQDVLDALNDSGDGLNATFQNGVLSISPDNDHYLKSMSSNLASALNIQVGYGESYEVETVESEGSTVHHDATLETTLKQLGLNTNNGKIVTNAGETVNVLKTDSIQTLIDKLGSVGVTATLSAEHTFVLGSAGDTNYVVSISDSISDVLGVFAGDGDSYKVSTQAATTNSTLAQLGMSGLTARITTDYSTIDLTSTSTIQDVLDGLNDSGNGLNASFENGVLTITPANNHYLKSMSSNLSDVFNINAGYGETYDVIIEGGTNTTTPIIATTATALSTLGLTQRGSIITDNQTINVETTDTIASLMNKLSAAGISSDYNETTGVFTLGATTDEHYVQNISTQLARVLGDIDVGQGYTFNTVTNTETTYETITSQATINTGCTFGEFGVTAEGGVINLSNGQKVTVNSDTTVASFMTDMGNKGINVYLNNGTFTLEPQEGVFIESCTGQNILNAMNIFGSTYTTSDKTLGNTKLKDLKDSEGNFLGITSGTITAYKNGIANTITIDNNSTLDELAAQLSGYNMSVTYGSGSVGRISINGTGDSYLSEVAEGSNLLTALGISSWDETMKTTSGELSYTTGSNNVITGDTKIVNLKDSAGNSLGITEGKYKVVASGINYEGTITDTTSINDLFTDLARYGITGSINSNGQITLNTANDDTYLVSSNGAAGYSNMVDTLFPSWTYGNIYASGSMDVTKTETNPITRETRLKDIDQGTYQAGKFIVSSSENGDSVLELDANATVGDFMAALSYHGFNTYIENGRVIARNDGYTTLKNYTVPSQSTNVIDLLGLDTDPWELPGHYSGAAQTEVTFNTVLEAATLNTSLANLRDAEGNSLGITTGDYIVHSNGLTHTVTLSSTDTTLNSFINTLAGYGINAIFDTEGGQSVLKLVGNGDSYVESSTAPGASNVVEKLFGNGGPATLYNYSGYEQTTELVSTTVVASLGTMVSEYDNGDIKSAGILALTVDGNYTEINITDYETFGSLLEKFERAGVQASMENGVIRLETGNKVFEIDEAHTTSNLVSNLGLMHSNNLGGFAASSDSVTQTTTTIEDRTLSVAKYADYDTQLGLLNISSGTLSVYRNGAKQLINIDNTETFSQLRSRINNAFGDVDIDFENGKLRFFSTTEGIDVQVGSSNDTSNMSSICGFSQDENGYIVSARELYKVNASSLITASDLFRYGDVTEGTFIIGDDTFTITSTTTIQNVIAQINSSEKANASAYWDSVDGKLVISARNTGASMVNIEAGTSNFTDILGLTSSEWNPDGSVSITRIRLDSQEIGQNAKFTINGTNFQSASNVVTSDVSRIQGLTLNLKSASMGDTVTVTVGKDTEAVTEAVGEFVESYNELVENVEAELSQNGVLKDQNTLKFIKQQIRNLLVNTFAGATTFRNLAALGISTSAGNSIGAGDTSNAGIEFLYFDAEKFMEGYNKDADAVKNMLVGSDETPGILIQIENIVENALATGTGYFATANKSYTDKITSLNEKIRKANEAIEAYRARLESKFKSMDMLISQMQNQYNSFLGTGISA